MPIMPNSPDSGQPDTPSFEGPMPPPPTGQTSGMDSYGGRESILSKLIPLILGGAGLAMAKSRGGLGAAVSGFGQGFADQKLMMGMEERKRKHAQEDFMIQQAHKATMDLPDLSDLSPNELPPGLTDRLNELTQKHKEALSNDGLITPKEAAEILALRQSIEPSLQKVKDLKATSELKRQALAKQAAELAARKQQILSSGEMAPPPAPGQPDMTPEDYATRQAALEQRQIGQLELPASVTDAQGREQIIPRRNLSTVLAQQTREAGLTERARNTITSQELMNDARVNARLKGIDVRERDNVRNNLVSYLNLQGVNGQNPEERNNGIDAFFAIKNSLTPGGGGNPKDALKIAIEHQLNIQAKNLFPFLKPGESRKLTVGGKWFTVGKTPKGQQEIIEIPAPSPVMTPPPR